MAHDDSPSRANVSRLTKSLLFVQSLIIVALSIWLYREYLNNQYFQTYLAGVFQGQGSIVAILGLGGLLAIGMVGILLKAGNIMGEIEHLSSKIEDQTGTVQAVESPSPMPVLEVVDPHSIDDIGRIHGSMRRWNDRSKYQDRS
jgi:hypothetical protein